MKRYSLATLPLSITIGLSPIYWLPGLPVGLWSSLKLAVFILGVFAAIFVSLSGFKLRLSRGIHFLSLFFLLAITGLLSSLINGTLPSRLALILGLPAFFFLSVYALSLRNPHAVERTFIVSASIFFAAYIVFMVITASGVVIRSPLVETQTLNSAGFGGLRTGWATGVSLMSPYLLILPVWLLRRYYIVRLLSIFFVGSLLIFGLFTVGGRGGLLATFVGMLSLMWVFGRLTLTGLAIGAVIITVSAYQNIIVEKLRFDRLGGGLASESLDYFSAGRLELYGKAIELIAQRPLLGWGFGEGGFTDEVLVGGHMLWLRVLGEGGLFFFIPTLLIVWFPFKRAVRVISGVRLRVGKLTKHSDLTSHLSVAAAATIINGVVISFVEPNVIFGTFYNSMIWWASAAYLLSLRMRELEKDSLAPPLKGGF